MIKAIKTMVSALFERLGYSIIRTGSLKTLTGGEVPFAHRMTPRIEHAFAHSMVHGYPNVQLTSYEVACTVEDERIAERLLRAYHRARKDERSVAQKSARDLWDLLQADRHKEFIELLEKNDPAGLAKYLVSMSKLSITHGLSQGTENYDQLMASEDLRRRSAAFFMDKLVALGEALGCLSYENPEFGRWGENLYVDIDELVAKIEQALGIDIMPPKISSGLFGISAKKGILHFRDVHGIYTAWRIRELVKDRDNPAICEIGAGTGRVAYYCSKMGLRNLTIIDLPYVLVLSGYYLIKGLPDANIVLYGEDESRTSHSIKLSPYWRFADAPDDYFELTLNQDSFPEIARDVVLEYLRQIRRNTKRYLLSINQESQNTQTGSDNLQLVVSQLIKSLGNGYERVYRFPYWVREGHIEELFRIVK